MKFLVTGGAGFIGSHITQRLLKEGNFVRILDNFSSGKQSNIDAATAGIDPKQFEVLRGDIQDTAMCDKACAGMDYVLHQAALRSVPKSMVDPLSYNHVNIDGTFFLLQASLKHKVKRFVFASSSSVYGDTDKFPQQEDALPLLISPYALSKLANEYYCRIFTNAWGLETVGLRYFNVFGPRQALDDEYAVVIPKFIHCILHDEQPPIFGNGKQSRDFTFIDNVVDANIAAATTPGIKHEVFNVANGKDNTILQLVDSLNKIIGKKIEPKFLPVRAGDVFKTCADVSKIKAKLGFQGKVDFEEGLRRTVEFFKGVYKK